MSFSLHAARRIFRLLLDSGDEVPPGLLSCPLPRKAGEGWGGGNRDTATRSSPMDTLSSLDLTDGFPF